jgi:drug/metabolite transporter (DMT)-like permease
VPVPLERKAIDGAAIALMVLLCLCWAFQQVTIKVAAAGVSPVMQAGLRSIAAGVLVLLWTRLRGIPLFARDRTLGSGLLAGVLFAAEFLFIYVGLSLTTAARMVVFLYLAPCLTALGLAVFVPGERLRPSQWAGVLLAFLGILLAFGEGMAGGKGAAETRLGDAFGVLAAALWAATTVVVRATPLSRAPAAKTLLYQLAVSAAALPPASVLLGEPGVTSLTPRVVASLAYQGVVVAFASYLVWFWLLTRYLASRISVFAFLTPLFGVALGVWLLGEPVTPAFLGAAVLVGAGIALVNLPARGRPAAPAPESRPSGRGARPVG